ncbi:MAG: recombinase family protein, partial [Phyllobacterium sp.]|uniref:recombinase family protein n=1 Tax=Phyllobacterium sp. TaxID=1871046 RepID=UPI0030F01011
SSATTTPEHHHPPPQQAGRKRHDRNPPVTHHSCPATSSSPEGLLNNELYIGRLVWNRLRYVKDPSSGRRVSRGNPPESWIMEDVPDLRIVDDALWDKVKARQKEIDASPRVEGIKRSRFWERRRAQHILTGRGFCAACGGAFAAVGRDYLASSNARKLGTCDQRKSLRRSVLEDLVLGFIRDRLMQPDAVKAFISSYHQEINAGRDEIAAQRARRERELAAVQSKLDGLYDAVANGLRTPGLLARMEAFEADTARLEGTIAEPPPSPVRLHPNLAEVYRKQVIALGEALSDPLIRDEAIAILRNLIARVDIGHDCEGWQIDLQGEITALIALGMRSDKKSPSQGSRLGRCVR